MGFIEVDTVAAATYMVGDGLGWTVPSTYPITSLRLPPRLSCGIDFVRRIVNVMSILISAFNWTGTHNVAEVSKAEYDNCTQVVSVLGSPVEIQLLKGGSNYYICTVDSHCNLGQKLSITVGSSTAAPTSPSNSASSTAFDSSVLVPAFITIACLNLLCHNTRH
ncbi:mavicyanin [Eucalyptus grandis]|uniref:mavicyanin n=1 Tax=Eucalyptus grandis TaxID=71139 RepID=UPI00192E948A|nr:mavicyanin [Eucalyptus grandis]